MPASTKHLTDKKLNLTSLLARWKDGLYYTAAIVRCDKTNKKCLVCFEDGSEVWVNNRDVHIQLSLEQLNEDEDIVCCICDDGCSEPPNEIILCDVCQQGYHQKCHNPPVDSSKIDESEDTSDHKDWFCATCSYILNQSNRAKLSADAQQQQHQKPQQSQPNQAPPQLQPKPKSPQPKSQQPEQPKSQQSQKPKVQSQAPQQVSPQPTQRQPATKSKPQPAAPQVQTQPQQTATTIGPVKTSVNNVQKPAPYYPLSSQARVVATSSTAALASMTASSALVVGSSAGRTKQDLVNQSNKSSQRQRSPASNVEVISAPVKHAVRKSSVNFVTPVRQSALPTATRSVLPNTPPPPTPPKVSNLIATTATTPSQPVITTVSPISRNNNSNNNNNANSADATKEKQPQVTSQAPPNKKLATWMMSTQGLPTTKPNDQPKDTPPPPPPTPPVTSSNFNANNNCEPVAEGKVSVASSLSSPSRRETVSSSIIVTSSTVQPTVIVSAEPKQTGQNST